jgi:hypothetical protein
MYAYADEGSIWEGGGSLVLRQTLRQLGSLASKTQWHVFAFAIFMLSIIDHHPSSTMIEKKLKRIWIVALVRVDMFKPISLLDTGNPKTTVLGMPRLRFGLGKLIAKFVIAPAMDQTLKACDDLLSECQCAGSISTVFTLRTSVSPSTYSDNVIPQHCQGTLSE